MDVVGEVENGGTLRKLQQVALRRKHEHLILVKVHLELVHKLQVVVVLQRSSDVLQPVVQSRFALDALISPVRSQALFGYLVHALRPYLHLHPLVLGSEHRDVQALVAVRLRHRKPVSQSLRVRLIHVRDERVSLPALHFLLAQRRVNDDTDGKEVVNAVKSTLLLLHLLPYRVDALRTSLYVAFYAHARQLLAQRSYELLYICVA